MKTTTEIIKDAFKKAKMETVKDDRTKYLFRLLCDEMDLHFQKVKDTFLESNLFDTVMDGYSIYLNDFTIQNADGAYGYNGGKDIAVTHSNIKARGFKTIKGAMKYIEVNK